MNKEILLNSEAEKNRQQLNATIAENGVLSRIMYELDSTIKQMQEQNLNESQYLTELRENVKKQQSKIKKKQKKLFNCRKKIWATCDHDFKYQSESYGGNYDNYVCTKCGMVDMRKN